MLLPVLRQCRSNAAVAAALPPALTLLRPLWSDSMDRSEARRAESFYDGTVINYAERPVQRLSLDQMLHMGKNVLSDPSKIVQSAQFVQEELPKRLARRLLDLQLLPHLVVTNPHIKRVYTSYYHAFETLRIQPLVRTLEDNERFCVLLRRLVDEHAPMLDLLARGLAEVRAKKLVGPALQLDHFLEAMLRSRISRRIIAEQHLHIAHTRPGYIGSIATALDVGDALEFAGQRAVQVCTEAHGIAPEVLLSGDLSTRLPYIPAHLDYILYELLKNSMRAVVERHLRRQRSAPAAATAAAGGGGSSSSRSSGSVVQRRLPAVQARVCSGQRHVTVRISDQGGGLPPGNEAAVWGFGFTTSDTLGGGSSSSSGSGDAEARTAGRPAETLDGAFGAMLTDMADAPRRRYSLAGLGFGLPLSRLHARYFGGDLQLVDLPGHGVDAFVTLRRLDGAGWLEEAEGDTAGAGQAAAVAAALGVQAQLQGRRPEDFAPSQGSAAPP